MKILEITWACPKITELSTLHINVVGSHEITGTKNKNKKSTRNHAWAR